MPSLRQIRLATGLVLYVYVTLHFVNHALGNISVDAMESGLAVQKLIWQSLAGATILCVSLLTHMSLGFWALYERRRSVRRIPLLSGLERRRNDRNGPGHWDFCKARMNDNPHRPLPN